MKTLITLLTLCIIASAQDYTLAPDGSYVQGDDYVLTPDGSYVEGDDYEMAPDGSYQGVDEDDNAMDDNLYDSTYDTGCNTYGCN